MPHAAISQTTITQERTPADLHLRKRICLSLPTTSRHLHYRVTYITSVCQVATRLDKDIGQQLCPHVFTQNPVSRFDISRLRLESQAAQPKQRRSHHAGSTGTGQHSAKTDPN